VQALRPLNRLRWFTKAAQVRRYGADWRADPFGVAAYVFWDPEVGDFSYDLRNREVFAAQLAEALGRSTADVLGWMAEAERHPVLDAELRRQLRGRWDLHRRPQFGPRLGWYAIVRATRPRLVVETGIRHGLGALVLLAALERNADEGHPGELVSIDSDPSSGSLVPPGRFANWTRIIGLSPDALKPAVAGRQVDVLIHDTPGAAGAEAGEYDLALRNAADEVWLVSGSNGIQTSVLGDLAHAHGTNLYVIDEEPDHPVYPGVGMALARFRRP
jgi:hypothetical protein